MCRTISGLLAVVLLFAAGPLLWGGEKPRPLRYLRPGKEKLVLESEVYQTRDSDGITYTSVTDRGTEKMTLVARFDRDGKLLGGEAVQETAEGKFQARLKLEGTRAQVSREGGITDLVTVAANPIVTTAPDWSDIFLLTRRYDPKKAGKQEFPGIWLHPSRPHLLLTFTIERLGQDTVTVGERKLSLDRYRVRLRSGDYLVWADATGRTVRLYPAGKPAAFVVLEGFEDATRELK